MMISNAELQAENARLRAALAHSKDPCVYCQLPADKMGECRHGFPGCARADDMMGCPEFGASLQLYYLQEMLTEPAVKLMLEWREAFATLRDDHRSESHVLEMKLRHYMGEEPCSCVLCLKENK